MDKGRNPFTSNLPPPTPSRRPNLSPFYFGLLIIGSTAVVLALYNLIIVAWCRQRRRRRRPHIPPTEFVSQNFETSSSNLVSSFKYRKETGNQNTDNECAVCLSAFEDGEDIRQLPNCNHSFHAPCIDMWLYSHSDCPLCRATVGTLVDQYHVHIENQNSQSSTRVE